MPRVSVILATYNRANLISDAIESVRAQSFAGWELIVSDDASADNTPEVVRAWCAMDPRIRYLRNERNLGIGGNSNRAIREAAGEYVAIIDDDDVWIDSEKLAVQTRFLDKHPDYVGCGGGVVVVDEKGSEITRYRNPETDKEIRAAILLTNPVANSTGMFRMAAAEAAGLNDEKIGQAADRDFWLKLGLHGKLYNFPAYFMRYRVTSGSSSIVNMRPTLRASLAVMKRYRRAYPRYRRALVVNTFQYWYALLPERVRRSSLHRWLFVLKQKIFKRRGRR